MEKVALGAMITRKLYIFFKSNYAGPIDDLDPDSNVLKLNKDLSGMEEMMTQSLQPKKFKYVFSLNIQNILMRVTRVSHTIGIIYASPVLF